MRIKRICLICVVQIYIIAVSPQRLIHFLCFYLLWQVMDCHLTGHRLEVQVERKTVVGLLQLIASERSGDSVDRSAFLLTARL